MKQWIPDARQALDDYLARVASMARCNGDDPEEIIEGLRAHIDEETSRRAPGPVVELGTVLGVLRELGSPEQVLGRSDGGCPGEKACAPETGGDREEHSGCWSSIPWVYTFAIALPAFSLVFELFTGYMGRIFVDPIPSLWHLAAGVVLLASLLFAQLLWTGAIAAKGGALRLALVTNGFALLLGMVYALVYLFVLPVAAVAILGFGLGLMGFSPLFCALAALLQCRRIHEMARGVGIPLGIRLGLTLAGAFAAGTFLGVYHGHESMQYRALSGAVFEGDAASIARLSTPGGERFVRRLCQHPILTRELLPWWYLEGATITAEQLRRVYFQITGADADLAKEVHAFSDRLGIAPEDDAFERVLGRSGNTATGPLLYLKESLIDASLGSARDGEAAPVAAYVEWTLEFANRSKWEPLEANACIQLPPGGVASRLTLWVNGMEQESAFGTRNQTEQAYRQVVARRRDPALLTTDGPDMVRLNCFPVPANGTMKVKVGMTGPVVIREGKGYLRLPRFVRSNVEVPGTFEHQVWVEARIPVRMGSSGFSVESSSDGTRTTRGKLANTALSHDGGTVMLEQVPALPGEWRGRISGFEGVTRIASRPTPSGAKVCLVVDGSVSMNRASLDWAKALSALPQDAEVSVVYCGADQAELCPATDRAEQAQWLKDRPHVGGCDPCPGLLMALDLLRDREHAVLVWVHAPIPVRFDSAQLLEQWIARRGGKDGTGIPDMLSLCTEPGMDPTFTPLGALSRYMPVPLCRGAQQTLEFTLRMLAPEDVAREYTVTEETGDETLYGHVARLCVADAVNRLVQARQHDAAAKMAATCRLVTPASGAVVLETAQQYQQNGLNPGSDPNAIPSVPEPSEWALIAAATVVLAVTIRARRRNRTSGAEMLRN